ncbi:MAG: isoleucine--tRNA ligase [Candidatus Micrarchaeia archaeon]
MDSYEEDILKYWEEHGILDKVRVKNRGNRPFYFLDGPPYVSGELHPGQLWVKGIKDIIIRYKRMKGYDVHDRAGYDVQGLPTEHAVEKSMNIKSKRELESKVSTEKFIAACREYVDSLIEKMNKDYLKFGVSLDFKDAYKPYRNQYIEKAWNIFKRISEKGLLYNEGKPITYCPSCETVLAPGSLEVEYSNEIDPSILVAFKINTDSSKPRIEADDTYLLVWTTTPWTLPANISIAANPKELYVKAKIGDKKFILAKKRLDTIVNLLNQSAIVEAEFYGSDLEGLYYINPLEEKVPIQKKFRKEHKVIFSDTLVSMDEGTGLVHIAPGHGAEDYKLGKERKIPIFSPVDMHAKYTKEAGVYEGLVVPDEANKKILEDLKTVGALLNQGEITHSYPHCWRCGSKLIYLATEQWFINIQKIKKKLVNANEKIIWHPKEAQEWEAVVLRNTPDWVISRQRFWGIPIPIWRCEKCGNMEVIGSLSELESKATDKEYVKGLSNLHRPYIDGVVLKCEKCGGEMHRVKDVFDVWFDSSIAFEASLSKEEFERLYPVDLIIEGIDQMRGWFSSMLRIGVILYGKSPYKEVVADGMLLAEDGREMHKHLGNYVPPGELFKYTTADAFRLWVSSHTQWLNLMFKKEEIKESEKLIMVLHNISNLMKEYSEALGYTDAKLKPDTDEEINAWISSRLNNLIKEVEKALTDYNVHIANMALKEFLLNDFSRFYLKIAKKKIIYGNRKTAHATLNTINYVFYNLLLLFSPIIPFTAEKLYLDNFANNESIFFEKWPKAKEKYINNDLEESFKIAIDATTAILNSREKAKIKLRWPLSSAILEVKSNKALKALERLSNVIEDYANIKKLELKEINNVEKEIRPIYQKLGPEFRENAKIVADALIGSNAEELERSIAKNGYYELHTEKGLFNIKPEHFSVVEKNISGDTAIFEYGVAQVNPEMNKALFDEAMYRELVRRIQLMRKELKLKKIDKINIRFAATGEVGRIIKEKTKELSKETNAKSINEGVGEGAKKFDILDDTVEIELTPFKG